MRYTALHGSPSAAFTRFDPKRSGRTSGYAHAEGVACFTSSIGVASHYAEGEGFIGRFAFHLENPLEIDDRERPTGIAAFLASARTEGHDGVILRACDHDALSPDEPSDIFFVFDVAAPVCVDTLQDGPAPSARTATVPAARPAPRRHRH